jgi:hypothetical protein
MEELGIVSSNGMLTQLSTPEGPVIRPVADGCRPRRAVIRRSCLQVTILTVLAGNPGQIDKRESPAQVVVRDEPDYTIAIANKQAFYDLYAKSSLGVVLNQTGRNGFVGSSICDADGIPPGVLSSFLPAGMTGTGSTVLSLTSGALLVGGTFEIKIECRVSGYPVRQDKAIIHLQARDAPDDTATVQAKIDACPPKGTVVFQGSYYISSPLVIKPDCTYQGRASHSQSKPVLYGYRGERGPGGYPILQITSKIQNISFNNMIFDGGGLVFTADDTNASHVTIDRCVFQNINNTGPLGYDAGHLGLLFNGAKIFSGLNITHSSFYSITYGNNITYGTADLNFTLCSQDPMCRNEWSPGALQVFAATDYNITDNHFEIIGMDAIKQVQNLRDYRHSGPYHIDRNTFYQVHRMPIEDQDGHSNGSARYCVNNLTVNRNYIGSFIAPYYGTMGLSLPLWCGINTEANENTILLVPDGQSPINNRYNFAYGIEMGVNRANNNVIKSVNGATGPAYHISVMVDRGELRGNKICGPSATSTGGGLFYGVNNSNHRLQLPTIGPSQYSPTCSPPAIQ